MANIQDLDLELQLCWLAGTKKSTFLHNHSINDINNLSVVQLCDTVLDHVDKNHRKEAKRRDESYAAVWHLTGHCLRGIANIQAIQLDTLHDMVKDLYCRCQKLNVFSFAPAERMPNKLAPQLNYDNVDYNLEVMSADEFARMFSNNNNVPEHQITLRELPEKQLRIEHEMEPAPFNAHGQYNQWDIDEEEDEDMEDGPTIDQILGNLSSVNGRFKSGIGEPLASSTPRHEAPTAMIMDADSLYYDVANIVDDHLIETGSQVVPNINVSRALPTSATVIVQTTKRQRKKKQSRLIIEAVTTLSNKEMMARKDQTYIECAPPKIHGLQPNVAENLVSFEPFDKKSIGTLILKQNKVSKTVREIFASKPMLTIPKRSPIQALFPKLNTTMAKDADDSILEEILNVDDDYDEANEVAHEGAEDNASEEAHYETHNEVTMDELVYDIPQNPLKRSARTMQRVTEDVNNPENMSVLDNSSWNDEHLDNIQNDIFKEPLQARSPSTNSPSSDDSFLILSGTVFHELIVQCHQQAALPIDGDADINQEALAAFCKTISLDPLLHRYCELATLKKLIWYWQNNVHPINMKSLTMRLEYEPNADQVRGHQLSGAKAKLKPIDRLSAAKTFASLMVLKKKRLVEITGNERNEIVHISKGPELSKIQVF